jgi:gliding motility-associated-like protein
VNIVGCNDQERFDWLLFQNCLPQTLVIDFAACPGDSVLYNGVYIQAGSSMTFNFIGYLGCDSTIIAAVMPLPSDASSLELFACPNGTVSYNGVALTPGSQQDFILSNQFGCDSVVTVTVSLLAPDTTQLELFACPNGTVSYNGVALTPGSQQDFIFTNVLGCDSTVQVSVTALEVDSVALQLLACQGSTVDYNGVALAPGAQQAFTFINQAGCDSVVVVSVGQAPTQSVAKDTFACQGTSIVYNGQTVNAGQTSVFTLANQYGCDSVVILKVLALPPDQHYLNLNACLGSSVNYNGVALVPGAQRDFVFTNLAGCDSTVTVTVVPYPPANFALSTEETCWNVSDGSINVNNVQGGTPPFQYSLDGTSFSTDPFFDQLAGGEYTVFIQDGNGCLYQDIIEVPATPPMTVQVSDASVVCGASIELSPKVVSSTPVSWQWQDGSTSTTYLATLPGVYMFSVTNDCETIDQNITVSLLVDSLASEVFIPNAFSPNDDGINDCFRGFVKPDLQVLSYELKVFDRWGDMVFDTDQLDGCWDGRFKGKKMNPAVLVWYVRMRIVDCYGQEATLFKEGGVQLLR